MSFQVKDVEEEYEKDPNLKREDVKSLSQWMDKQPHLPKASELQLVLFLQSCYYRLEPAKKAIDNFFTVRTLCPDIFSARNLETLMQQLSVGCINVLPKKTPEGYAVSVMKLLDPNPDHYHHLNQINYADSVMMLKLHQIGTSKGFVTVMDMKGLSFGHLTKFNLMAMKKHLFYVQEALPVRIKGVHYINVVPFVDKLMAMIRPFLKKELVEMIHFHSESLDSLYKFVPKEIMPEDYGGEEPSMATLHEQNKKNIVENIEFFKWLDSLKVDESKRPGKPKNAGDIFGVDGSFKKLEVD